MKKTIEPLQNLQQALSRKTGTELEQQVIADALKTLPPREEKILDMRFGIKDGFARTLQEVGTHFNVSRERIRQLEARALRRLAHHKTTR